MVFVLNFRVMVESYDLGLGLELGFMFEGKVYVKVRVKEYSYD